jgi:starch-binding outer membrane protein, SusD/RagB family
MKTIYKYKLIFILSLGLVALWSCENLNVENYNEPDTASVLASSEDIRTVLEGSYLSYWQTQRSVNIHIASLVAADQFTCSWGNYYMRYISAEPRTPWDNSVSAPNDQISENFWNGSYAALSQVNDAIKLINSGTQIGTNGVDNKSMLAFGYFMQGLVLGNIGLAYDKGYIVNETTDLSLLDFSPYTDVIKAAIASLEKAISIAGSANAFVLNSNTINGVTVNNSLIISLSHSYIARFLALAPRTAAQNQAVDWQKVLDNAKLGITTDFGPEGDGSPYANAKWYDENFIYLAQSGWARIDNRIINLMDQTYPKKYWTDGVAQVVHTGLTAGQAQSSDKRLLSDYQFLASVDFRPDRGYYHFSNYRYSRFDETMYKGLGKLHEFRAYENALYKAEASVMLSKNEDALSILNSASLPRKVRGALTDLPATSTKAQILSAIFYERDIELTSQAFMIGFYDMRRRDMLQKGQFLHYPVPGKELETLGLPLYTFGGVANADGINTSNAGWF